MTAPLLFDRQLLRKRRLRTPPSSRPDFLQARAAMDMAERLGGVQRSFQQPLCIGADAKRLANQLCSAMPEAECFVTLSPDGISAKQTNLIQILGDEECLPFGDGTFDLIASALTLQLVNDLPGALIQIRRALKPDGMFLCSVLGGQTLIELREAFMAAEIELEGGVSPRVVPMADIREYGGLLQRAGFTLPVTDSDLVTVTYRSPLALMHDLRAMGVANPLIERRKTPLRRTTLMRAIEIYFERFSQDDGRVLATFEIIHMAGWSPHESQQKPLRPGSAVSRLADALGATEQPFNTKLSK